MVISLVSHKMLIHLMNTYVDIKYMCPYWKHMRTKNSLYPRGLCRVFEIE